MLLGGGDDRTASVADARIDDHHIHRVGREVAVGVGDGDGAVEHVVGLDRVADVHDLGIRIDAVDHALHRAHVVVTYAEIRGQGDDALNGRHESLSWSLNRGFRTLSCVSGNVNAATAAASPARSASCNPAAARTGWPAAARAGCWSRPWSSPRWSAGAPRSPATDRTTG